MDVAVGSGCMDLHFGVDFSVVFEGVEGLQDGVVVVGTCKWKIGIPGNKVLDYTRAAKKIRLK